MTRYSPVTGHRGISRYLNADGKTVYRVQVYAGRDWQTGKRQYVSQQPFRTLKAAEEWQVAQKDKIRRGETVEPSMLPFGQWAAQWVDGLIDAAPKSVITYRNRIALVTPALGNVPISRVTPAMLETMYAELKRAGRNPNSIRSIHSTIRAIFGRAVEHGLIHRNPAQTARPPAAKKREQPTWTAEQLRHFLAVTADDPYWSIVFRFMAETWVRIGELTDLRWGSVGLDGRVVTIERTVTVDRDRKRASGQGKTAAARRTIPITSDLADALRHHRDKLRFIGRDVTDTGLVFPAPKSGGWLVQPSVANALKRGCEAAGLPVLTPHGLRHTGGSIAYRAGVNIKLISERLGHSTPAFTLAIYTHTAEDDHRAVSDEIGRLLSG